MLTVSAPRRNRTYNLVIKSQYIDASQRRMLSYIDVSSRFTPPSEQKQKRQKTPRCVQMPHEKPHGWAGAMVSRETRAASVTPSGSPE